MGVGIAYYNKLIFNNLHFLYVSFIIFVLLGIYVFIYSIIDKNSSSKLVKIDYQAINVNRSVKIAWILLIIVMIGLYLFFN